MIDEYAVHRPGEGLRSLVAWCVGYRQAGIAPAVHRGLPSPWLTMIVTLDEPLVIARHPDPRQPASTHDFLLGGLHTAPAMITHEGRQSGIQLALTPLGARILLGLPAAELVSIDVEATDVLGRLADEIRERVTVAPDWPDRFAVLESFLVRRVAQAASALSPRPEVSYAWDRLRRSRGAVSVADLAAETGWSARHLGAQFRAETGLSPKAAGRVIRFDQARRRLLRPGAPGDGRIVLAELATECGYYDQAHLARDFRELAGCPPSVLLAEELRNVQAELTVDWAG